MKLAVITKEFGAAVNVGGGVETHVQSFQLPPEIALYIENQRGPYCTVTLGIEIELAKGKAEGHD